MFPERAKRIRDEGRHNIIVAGLSYGQVSSREFVGICPKCLGVRAVIAKSFERIHKANLINFGIIPFNFKAVESYDPINWGIPSKYRKYERYSDVTGRSS
jgi:aconitate hydratase